MGLSLLDAHALQSKQAREHPAGHENGQQGYYTIDMTDIQMNEVCMKLRVASAILRISEDITDPKHLLTSIRTAMEELSDVVEYVEPIMLHDAIAKNLLPMNAEVMA